MPYICNLLLISWVSVVTIRSRMAINATRSCRKELVTKFICRKLNTEVIWTSKVDDNYVSDFHCFPMNEWFSLRTSYFSFSMYTKREDHSWTSTHCCIQYSKWTVIRNSAQLLTFQASSRFWSTSSVLTLRASELNSSACCINTLNFGSSSLRNVSSILQLWAAKTW